MKKLFVVYVLFILLLGGYSYYFFTNIYQKNDVAEEISDEVIEETVTTDQESEKENNEDPYIQEYFLNDSNQFGLKIEGTKSLENFSLDEIRDSYVFDESCQGTVPYALEAFFESKDFEDAIRNAISIGGDSDTIAAICGSVASAYYGITEDLKLKALEYFEFEKELINIIIEFEEKFLGD